jgi:hypothetical protein
MFAGCCALTKAGQLIAALSAAMKSRRLFDHLVCAHHGGCWNCDAERIGCLEINDQLELGGLFDRKVGRIGSVENLAGIDTDLAIRRRIGRAIGDQTADDSIYSRRS